MLKDRGLPQIFALHPFFSNSYTCISGTFCLQKCIVKSIHIKYIYNLTLGFMEHSDCSTETGEEESLMNATHYTTEDNQKSGLVCPQCLCL